MFYLTLFLCSKFSVTIPYLLPQPYTSRNTDIELSTTKPNRHQHDSVSEHSKTDFFPPRGDPSTPARKQAAAPPVYLLLLPLIPISIAFYISSTRFSDFRHHGFDIIFGSSMGIAISWLSFRMYHMPIQRGAGWSWGPRSTSRAWGIGIGVGGYAGEEGASAKRRDLETGDGPSNAPLSGSGNHDFE